MDNVGDLPINVVEHEYHLDDPIPDSAADNAPLPVTALAGTIGAHFPAHDGFNLLDPAPVLGRMIAVPIVPSKAMHTTFIS